MIRKILVILGFILSVFITGVIIWVLVLVFGGQQLKPKTNNDNAPKIQKVRVSKISPAEIQTIIRGEGRVSSNTIIKISSEVQGKIISGNLKKGTQVSAGQILFKIDAQEYILSIKARKSAFMTQIASILPDVQLDYSSSFSKWNDYYASIDPDKALPEIPSFSTTKEKTFIASKGILTEYYTIRGMEERLTKYIHYAPFSGTITNSYADVGMIVNPGSPLVDLIKQGVLEIEVPLSKEESKTIKVGQTAQLVNKSTGEKYTGRVNRMGKFINPNTQSIPVYVTVNNSEGLLNGMYLEASFDAFKHPDAIKLPLDVIKNSTIHLLTDSLAIPKQVNILSSDNTHAIVSGVSNDDVIIMETYTNVSDSIKVSPVFIKN